MFTSRSNHIKPLNLSKFAVRIPQPLTIEIGSHGSPHLSALERTTKAFSPSVERRALRTLRQLCEELLQRCPEERRQSDARIMAEPELLQRLPTKDHGGWMRLGSEGEGNRPVFQFKDGIQCEVSGGVRFFVRCIGLIIRYYKCFFLNVE